MPARVSSVFFSSKSPLRVREEYWPPLQRACARFARVELAQAARPPPVPNPPAAFAGGGSGRDAFARGFLLAAAPPRCRAPLHVQCDGLRAIVRPPRRPGRGLSFGLTTRAPRVASVPLA